MGYTLTILGCGVMGQALLSAIYNAPAASGENKDLYPSKIITCNHNEESKGQVVTLLEGYKASPNGIEVECTFDDNERAVNEASVVLLATKPFLAQQVLSSVNAKTKLLISLVAGWTIEQLGEHSEYVTRIMTNTPAKFGYGMAVLSHSSSVSDHNKELVKELVGHVGSCIELPEKNMDAATALVGSGPAFVLLMLESLMESGIKMGIPLKESRECAVKVLEGTAKMVEKTGEHPSVLKHQVCTPGGTTIAGLCVMEEKGVRSGIISGVEEAAAVASRLGKK
ncbi:LANO_0H24454g1_1 [Lachancea nothofagi CBS 11611]|uniref:Pyrroline-5-carboxylate reductase n=1 Tax=Lachancea nothofagi CBS 11611 TaxID=1266666 RepID=A0A1G4KNT4_9SACH|nr:LANO_0H24454g1_1 [Lachancea nothofagi CBS 11611]